MHEAGEVIDLCGDTLVVKMRRKTMCGRCKACTIGSSPDEMILNAINECGAHLGDKVRIEVSVKTFWTATLVLYGIPLLFFLSGSYLGMLTSDLLGIENYAPLLGIAMGLLLLFAAYTINKKLEPRRRTGGHIPRAVEIVD